MHNDADDPSVQAEGGEELSMAKKVLLEQARRYWRQNHKLPNARALGCSTRLWEATELAIERLIFAEQRRPVFAAIIDHYWRTGELPGRKVVEEAVGFPVPPSVYAGCGYERAVEVINRYRAIGAERIENRAQEFARRITRGTSSPETNSWEEGWLDRRGNPIDPGSPAALRRLRALARGFKRLEEASLFGRSVAEAAALAACARSILGSPEEQRRHLKLLRERDKRRPKQRPVPRAVRADQLVFTDWKAGLTRRHSYFDQAEGDSPEESLPADPRQLRMFTDAALEQPRRSAHGA